jgi:ubiquinone/menaquinone biosynthesis C-methylase UbiE
MKSTSRFGSRARDYAAFRPSYPQAAIDAALQGLGDPRSLTIADVGAGTGISARLFAQRCASVIAIEPNAQMCGTAKPHPHVVWREGTAEHTGLADSSVDAVVACQAFHWFATHEAMTEFRRIARRRAVLLQYERDEEHAFTKAYGDIVRLYATDDTEALRRAALSIFANFPRATVTRSRHSSRQLLDREGLIGRAASSSYLPQQGAAAESLKRDLRALYDRFADKGPAELAMITFVLVADW